VCEGKEVVVFDIVPAVSPLSFPLERAICGIIGPEG
jgi:hypothetical protein